MKFKFTMGELSLVYVEVHCSIIVKLFISTRPGNGVILCFDTKISLYIPFTMPNVNALTRLLIFQNNNPIIIIFFTKYFTIL